MKNAINMTSRSFGKAIVGFAAVLNIFAAISLAQNVKNTDNSPDKALKSNARVNPSTLAMEMSIPLIGYAGRADNGMPASISYSSKVWGMQNYGSQWFNNLEMLVNDVRPQFAKNSAAGWSSSLGTVRIDYSWDPYHAAYNSAPETEGQIWSPVTVGSSEENNNLFYVKRVQVIMPDGSSHEFRSSDTPIGCGTIVGGGCTGTDFTGTYLSVDSSRMRFESGTNSSTLYLPNGSRYVFGSLTGTLNLATTFYDVHGNKMTFNSTNRTWTDTLGRVIEDPLPNNWNGVQNQTIQNDSVPFPGFNSGNYNVIFGWSELDDALLTPSDALRFIGRKSCNGSGHTLLSPYLFDDGGEHTTRLCNLGAEFNPVVLSKVTLPNGQFYEFKYNVFGEITKVIYPSGAYERFVYSRITSLSPGNYAYGEANRGVTERYVSEKGDGTDEIQWNYSVTGGLGLDPYFVTTTAPDGTYSQQYIHMDGATIPSKPYGFSTAIAGRAYDERSYDSNGVLRARKLTTWEETGPLSGGHTAARRDMRPTKEISMIFEPGDSNALATMSETVYDTTGNSDAAYFSSLNPKQTKNYHYLVVNASTAASANITTAAGWFSAATPATVSEMDYLYDANYKARNINGLVTETRVKDANGNVKAKSQIAYDETAYPLLTDVSSIRWEDPNTNYRGLVTTTKSWSDIANNLHITTHAQYDRLGNARKSWDGNGNLSQVEYSSTYDHAYPTKTISPDPDGAGAITPLETTVVYDYNTGLPTSTTDANGQTTQMEYGDPLLRPTKTIAPNGHQTITEYGAGTSELTRFVKSRSQIDETNWKEAYSWFDGLGRAYKSQSVDSVGDVFTESLFDEFGRPWKTSNPYRNGETKLWTENFYDTAGRVWKVKTPDGAEVDTAWGLATTGSQIGAAVTVTDQAEKQRRSITNALGQLTSVDEPNNAGQLGTVASPNQPTLYAYDKLNNLTTVTQAGSGIEQCGPTGGNCSQTRTFSYNSLSRLLSATNPESGTISYVYDNNGNLTQKTDARGVQTGYVYDTLSRVTNRNYSTPGGTPPNYLATPNVTYTYDDPLIANSKGKLTKVTNGSGLDRSTTEYTSFDILGRVTGHKQTTDGTTYTTGYLYNRRGALIEETYPSGRVVKNILDNEGDLALVQSKKNSTNGYWTYANSFSYNAAGAVTSLQLGNGRWESTVFNSRLQPTQIGLGTVQNGMDKLKLEYGYGTTANNGNVLSQKITVKRPSQSDLVFDQTYTYDSLNRITSAEEKTGTTVNWNQTYTFDRYGNRNFNESLTTTLPKNCGTSPNFTVCPADVPVVNPSVNAGNNRLNGVTYDAAGNVITDAEGRTFTYDAENKQIEVKNSSELVVGTYYFDGDGNRVKKVVPATSEVTIFVYNAGGKLVAEYSTIVEPTETAKVQYLTNDNLGTPRINTDANGAITSRSDYMPYGEEIIGLGNRTANENYVADTVRQGFTGYIDDGETGLDFAQARMYAKLLGRFSSADPLLSSGRSESPQTWNKFTYVLNSPLKLIDPLGLYECTAGKEKCKKFEDAVKEAIKAMKQYDPKSKEYKSLSRALGAYWNIKKDTSKLGLKDGLKVIQGADKDIPGFAMVESGFRGQIRGKTLISLKITKLEIHVKSDAWDNIRLPDVIANEGANVQDARDAEKNLRENSEWDKEYTSLEAAVFVHQKLRPNDPLDFKAGRVYDPAWEKTDLDANRDKGITKIMEADKKDGGYGLKAPKKTRP